jgi:hypothetical protein
MKIWLSIALLLCLAGAAWASLADAPIVFKAGNWSVLRDVDVMTDKTSCTGIYKEERSIQLTDDTLYIIVKGGLRSVTLRFGDQPAEPLRLATDMEEKVGAIEISGNDFTKLLGSARLRVQSMTLVRGLANLDLDLAGLSAAVENIRQGCPGEPLSNTAATSKPSLCSDLVVRRLEEKGVAPDIVKYVCTAP